MGTTPSPRRNKCIISALASSSALMARQTPSTGLGKRRANFVGGHLPARQHPAMSAS